MNATRIDAVLLESSNAEELVRFYREQLGIPMEEERHGPERHWGCILAGVHFAVHLREGLAGQPRNMAVSFEVADVDGAIEQLRKAGIPINLEPHDRPYGRLAAVRDPDGNLVYLHRYPPAPRRKQAKTAKKKR
jgi:catechol 2,3-dioxygenase-like lactoylglutathione lyase family enzyme